MTVERMRDLEAHSRRSYGDLAQLSPLKASGLSRQRRKKIRPPKTLGSIGSLVAQFEQLRGNQGGSGGRANVGLCIHASVMWITLTGRAFLLQGRVGNHYQRWQVDAIS
jgi:hypothetical protein